MTKRLLVVEDSKSIAMVIERMGRSLGYQVTIANSFAVAKHLISQGHKFFVATVDYGLPDAPNGEVVPFLIENKVPCIMMTGRMDDATHKRLLNYPIIDYITKENSQAYHYLLRILHGQLHNHEIGVLVVDDSLSSRNHVCQLLNRRNFKVYSVDGGPKAIDLLAQSPDIKIVITDQEMPGMDGIELVQKMRKLKGKSELIIMGLSGASRNFQSARFIKNGADDFLQKPFCPEEFYCRIMLHIEKIKQAGDKATNANLDYLTELHHRGYFIEQTKVINRKAQNGDNTNLLVIFAIDKFPHLIDEYGYELTDSLLTAFGKLLKPYSTEHLIARMEAGEFGLVLSGQKIEVLEATVEKICEEARQLSIPNAKANLHFTVSAGGVLLESEEPVNELIQQARQALQVSLEGGGNQVNLEGFIDIS